MYKKVYVEITNNCNLSCEFCPHNKRKNEFISFESFKTILNKLCAFTQLHLDAVLSAHMHHFSVDESNETELFCNGSLMGTDDYAHELRLNSNPSQTLLVATPDNISSVIYKIKL